jgi:hypothetical protein
MNSHRIAHLFWAATLVVGLVSATFAQPQLAGAGIRQMDHAVGHRAIVDAGLAGQPFIKPAQQFDPSLITFPAASDSPGLQGSLERKPPRSLEGPIDPGSSMVKINSHPSPIEFVEAPAASGGTKFSKASGFAGGPSAAGDLTIVFDPRARLINPVSGMILEQVQTFRWTSAFQATKYWLRVGSCQDCTDILERDMGLDQSITVYLPVDGRSIYATLFTYYQGDWYWFNYDFYAPAPNPYPAQMLFPSYGATLSGTQTFRWTAGTYLYRYYLRIGSCQDCTDILDEDEQQNLERTISLPRDGRTLYVTLFTFLGGKWYWYDYQYRAFGGGRYNPTIYITNDLDYTINVLVNGTVVGSVPPQERRYANVRVDSLTVGFELVRPTLSGRALGDPMAGVFQTIYSPSGSYEFEVQAQIGQQRYFLPIITNKSSVPLLIEVNGGLESQNRCNCTAGANTTNVIAGYYKLFSNSNLRLFRDGSDYTGRYWFWGTDSDGRVGSSGILPPHVDHDTGRVYFTVSSAP